MTKNLDHFSFTSPGQHFQSIFCNETAYFTYSCDNDNNDQVLLRKDLLPPLTSPIPLTESRSTSRPRDTSPSVSSWLLLPPGPSCEAGEVCLYCGGAHPSPELAGDGGQLLVRARPTPGNTLFPRRASESPHKPHPALQSNALELYSIFDLSI